MDTTDEDNHSLLETHSNRQFWSRKLVKECNRRRQVGIQSFMGKYYQIIPLFLCKGFTSQALYTYPLFPIGSLPGKGNMNESVKDGIRAVLCLIRISPNRPEGHPL